MTSSVVLGRGRDRGLAELLAQLKALTFRYKHVMKNNRKRKKVWPWFRVYLPCDRCDTLCQGDVSCCGCMSCDGSVYA